MTARTSLQQYRFRKIRTRRKIFGTPARPRLTVYRSSKHIYAQVIDDLKGHTLATACTLDPQLRPSLKTGATVEAARAVGKLLAERAKTSQVSKVVFDRGGRAYHGRIKAVAEGAREGGLQF